MTAVDALLLDIEGTTTSIAFVHETLFPYSRDRLPAFLAKSGDLPEVKEAVEGLLKLAAAEGAPARGVEDAAAFAKKLIAEDRKAGPLKALQGLLWEEGYREGAYRSHVFDDVPGALERFRSAGVKLYIYSSGSIHAQKLLFGHTTAGDLTPLLSGYFDTTSGPKKEASSYRTIAKSLELEPGRILFLSDVVAELDAATSAGLRAIGLDRPGNAPQPPSEHRFIESFDALDLTRSDLVC